MRRRIGSRDPFELATSWVGGSVGDAARSRAAVVDQPGPARRAAIEEQPGRASRSCPAGSARWDRPLGVVEVERGSAATTAPWPETTRVGDRRPPRWPAGRPGAARGAGGGPFGLGEVGVAAGQGQAVGLADRRAAHDLDGDRQVGGHPPDDGELLEVLVTEVGGAGPARLNSLATMVATPSKCPGRAAPSRGPLDTGHRDRRHGGRPRGVHLLRRSGRRRRGPGFLGRRQVALERARIVRKSSGAPNWSGLT